MPKLSHRESKHLEYMLGFTPKDTHSVLLQFMEENDLAPAYGTNPNDVLRLPDGYHFGKQPGLDHAYMFQHRVTKERCLFCFIYPPTFDRELAILRDMGLNAELDPEGIPNWYNPAHTRVLKITVRRTLSPLDQEKLRLDFDNPIEAAIHVIQNRAVFLNPNEDRVLMFDTRLGRYRYMQPEDVGFCFDYSGRGGQLGILTWLRHLLGNRRAELQGSDLLHWCMDPSRVQALQAQIRGCS